MRFSELDNIPGVGVVGKQILLRVFKSLKGISNAALYELEQYLPRDVALNVYNHFKNKLTGESESCE